MLFIKGRSTSASRYCKLANWKLTLARWDTDRPVNDRWRLTTVKRSTTWGSSQRSSVYALPVYSNSTWHLASCCLPLFPSCYSHGRRSQKDDQSALLSQRDYWFATDHWQARIAYIRKLLCWRIFRNSSWFQVTRECSYLLWTRFCLVQVCETEDGYQILNWDWASDFKRRCIYGRMDHPVPQRPGIRCTSESLSGQPLDHGPCEQRQGPWPWSTAQQLTWSPTSSPNLYRDMSSRDCATYCLV